MKKLPKLELFLKQIQKNLLKVHFTMDKLSLKTVSGCSMDRALKQEQAKTHTPDLG